MPFKRLFDLVCAAIGLVLLSPLFILIAVWIRLDSPGPVLFRQVRVGRHGREFLILKFRTMQVDAERSGPQVSAGGDWRITRCGHVLRRHKLDELPQLVNVLKGEMSIVGPRPEVPQYVAAYPDEYRDILSIRPGLTDYAALEFHNEGELLRGVADPERTYLAEILPAKIRLYRRYREKQGILEDLSIIVRTIGRMLS